MLVISSLFDCGRGRAGDAEVHDIHRDSATAFTSATSVLVVTSRRNFDLVRDDGERTPTAYFGPRGFQISEEVEIPSLKFRTSIVGEYRASEFYRSEGRVGFLIKNRVGDLAGNTMRYSMEVRLLASVILHQV